MIMRMYAINCILLFSLMMILIKMMMILSVLYGGAIHVAVVHDSTVSSM